MKPSSLFVLFIIVIIFGALLGPKACTRPNDTVRILASNGYTNIEITGWRPFIKSDSDTFSTGFRAVAPNGTVVTGAVCSGFLKGHTIRLD